MVSLGAGADALRDPWVVTYCIFLGLLTAQATVCRTILKIMQTLQVLLRLGGWEGAETICHSTVFPQALELAMLSSRARQAHCCMMRKKDFYDYQGSTHRGSGPRRKEHPLPRDTLVPRKSIRVRWPLHDLLVTLCKFPPIRRLFPGGAGYKGSL